MIIRLLDIVISLTMLIILAVPMGVIAIAIAVYDGFPVIFRQVRIGINGRTFTIYKFRSMRNATDASRSGQVQGIEDKAAARAQFQTTQVNDPRITPVGRVIRKTHLDELPQFFNVLLGDMSLVGVRPDTPAQEADYSEEYWVERHKFRPGITGTAQVHNTSLDGMDGRTRWEKVWNAERSVTLYIKLLLLTARKVVKRNSF